jgi:xanthine dehydrogenase accessory factor
VSGSLHRRIAELEAANAPAAVVTVVRTAGSTPREMGARMLVLPSGAIEGTIGGGRVEQEAISEAQAALREGRPRYLEFKLTQELGMCCGGQVALFIEPLSPSPRLIVFGAGHVGAALVRLAAQAGFVVHVADEREELLDPRRLPEARRLHSELDDPELPFGSDAFIMVTTHDHALDQALVERALPKPHRWIGLIGSKRKAELTRQRLRHKGFSAEAVAMLRCPVGLAIRAETPEEIALAIAAELVLVRRGGAAGGAAGGASPPPELDPESGEVAARAETKARR